MATFPAGIYAGPTVPALESTAPTHSTLHTDAIGELVAIESTLGTNPQGASATVKARLDLIDAAPSTWTLGSITQGVSVACTTSFGRRQLVAGRFAATISLAITGAGTANTQIVVATPYPLVSAEAIGGSFVFADSGGNFYVGAVFPASTTTFLMQVSGTNVALGTVAPPTCSSGDSLRLMLHGWTV